MSWVNYDDVLRQIEASGIVIDKPLNVDCKIQRWKLVDGGAQLLDFNTRLDLAERMAEVIAHYGFTRVCTLGGSPPAMTYFRQ